MALSEYMLNLRAEKLGIKERPEKKAPKPIAKASKKRQVANRVYRKIVKEMAEKDNVCELKSPVCSWFMQGADHTQKRSPANLTKKKNLKRACNNCNLYKEQHPEWAKANGHSISRFKKTA